MTHATASGPSTAEADNLPPNARAMRASTLFILAAEEPETHYESAELEKLQDTFREHIRALIPAVGDRSCVFPQRSADRASALASIGEAELRLRLGNGDNDRVRGAVAVRLARSVKALCGHYERMAPRGRPRPPGRGRRSPPRRRGVLHQAAARRPRARGLLQRAADSRIGQRDPVD